MAVAPNILNRRQYPAARPSRPATPYGVPSGYPTAPQPRTQGPPIRPYAGPGASSSVPQQKTFGGPVPGGSVGIPQPKTHGPPIKATPKPKPQKPPLPFDPLYENQTGLLNRSYNDALAQFTESEAELQRRYGLDDPSDPFSQLRMLKQSFDRRRSGITNQMAQRQQLYSGATESAQEGALTHFNQGYDTLRKGQGDALNKLNRQRALAGSTLQQGLIDAESARLARALANRPDPNTIGNAKLPGPVPTSSGSVAQRKTHGGGKTTQAQFYRQYGTKGLTKAGWKEDARWLMQHGYKVPKRFQPKGRRNRGGPGSSGSVPQRRIP